MSLVNRTYNSRGSLLEARGRVWGLGAWGPGGLGAWGPVEASSDRKDCCQSMLPVAPVASDLQIKAPGESGFEDLCGQPLAIL
jgi:hypothetical protein